MASAEPNAPWPETAAGAVRAATASRSVVRCDTKGLSERLGGGECPETTDAARQLYVRMFRCESRKQLRRLATGRWRRSHAGERSARIAPPRAQPFGEPQRQRARVLERLLADR